jgi:exodeoxyribonuclease V beta subunit
MKHWGILVNKLDALTVPLSGAHFIEASAGTGKTYTIGTFVLRLILEKELSIHQILIVTFTEAATDELRSRIRQGLQTALEFIHHPNPRRTLPDAGSIENYLFDRIKDNQRDDSKRLRSALLDFDNAQIATIHGFCNRTIEERAFDLGKPFASELLHAPKDIIQGFYHRLLQKHLFKAELPFFVPYLANKKSNRIPTVQEMMRLLDSDDLSYVPAEHGLSATEAKINLERSHQKMASDWSLIRDSLLSRLFETAQLHKSMYKRAKVESEWMPEIDRLANQLHIDLPLTFPPYMKLTQSTVREKTKSKTAPPEHDFFLSWEQYVEADQQYMQTLEVYRVEALQTVARDLKNALHDYKDKWQYYTYSDMIRDVHGALKGPQGKHLIGLLQSDFKAVLVDEFQDTDPSQYEIFDTAFGNSDTSLFFIGDPKQSIYGFRGADVFTYTRAAQMHQDCKSTLTTNWRSDPGLLSALNEIFGGPTEPFISPDISYSPVDPQPKGVDSLQSDSWDTQPFQILLPPAQPKQTSGAAPSVTAMIASEVATLLNSETYILQEKVRACHIAVLCRTNSQVRAMKDALSEKQIPAVQYSDESVFSSTICEDFTLAIEAIASPQSTSAVRCALATKLFKYRSEGIISLTHDSEPLQKWMGRFRNYKLIWLNKGFAASFHAFMLENQIGQTVMEQLQGDRLTTDLFHLIELTEQVVRQDKLSPRAAGSWLREQESFTKNAASPAEPEHQLRLTSTDDAVHVMTVHKSKGLEFGIVFCPFFFKPKSNVGALTFFQDPKTNHGRQVSFNSPAADRHIELAALGLAQEDTRHFYVGVTRAKHQCLAVYEDVKSNAKFQVLKHFLSPYTEKYDYDALGLQHITDHVSMRPMTQETIRYAISRAQTAKPHLPRISVRVANQIRINSFSGIVAQQAHASTPDKWEKELPHCVAPDTVHHQSIEAKQEDVVPLASFPAGAQPGLFFHDIFEHLQSFTPKKEDLSKLVRETLVKYNLPEHWADIATDAYLEIVESPLRNSEDTFRLCDLLPAQTIPELEFIFPLFTPDLRTIGTPTTGNLEGNNQGIHQTELHSVSIRNLGSLFKEHEPNFWGADYKKMVSSLNKDSISGYMKGFIDLVFEHQGKWYILDYKSNRMGETFSDYSAPNLRSEMAKHHYFLQYLIYTVALDKHLSSSSLDYTYASHFGGVFYLFFRGMSKTQSPQNGVFFHRPNEALISELSQLLCPPMGGKTA